MTTRGPVSKKLWEIPCPDCGLIVGAYLNGDVEPHPAAGPKCSFVNGDPNLLYELNKKLATEVAALRKQLGIPVPAKQTQREAKKSKALTNAELIAKKQKNLSKRASKAKTKSEKRESRLSKQKKEAIAEYWEKRRSGYREVQGGSPGSGKRS